MFSTQSSGRSVQPSSYRKIIGNSGRTHTGSGALLLIASLVEVVAMAHHPTVQDAGTSQVIVEIARSSARSATVHGVLIALMLSIVYGLLGFVEARGPGRPLIRAGAIGYGFGVLAMLGAALVDGYIVTGLAALLPRETIVDLQISRQLLLLCRVLNQSCANFGVVAMSSGIFCWSLDLCGAAGWSRVAGVLGCAVGLSCALALILGRLQLDVHGMLAVIVAQAGWNVTVAVLLIRGARGGVGAPSSNPGGGQ